MAQKLTDLMTKESQWTQGAFARLPSGKACLANHADAVSCCLIGGIQRCYHEGPDRTEAMRMLKARFSGSITLFLDWHDAPDRKFVEVRALIEELSL